MRVRLVKDLSEYMPGFVVGAEGVAREDMVTFTAWEEPMVDVKIKGCGHIPIGWNALEIIDKRFWASREKEVREALNIEKYVGPRGGFKFLRVYSKNDRIFTTTNKLVTEKIEELAEKYNKKIQEIIRR